jgi:hypothetical protein
MGLREADGKAALLYTIQNYIPYVQIFTSAGYEQYFYIKTIKENSLALVRKQTIPTEQPPLVSEVSANFCG